jgi:hypothetical protein
MGIEDPTVLEAGSFGLARQTDDAINGNVWLQRNAKLHGRLFSSF